MIENLFGIEGWSIAWYGVIIAVGMVLGVMLAIESSSRAVGKAPGCPDSRIASPKAKTAHFFERQNLPLWISALFFKTI